MTPTHPNSLADCYPAPYALHRQAPKTAKRDQMPVVQISTPHHLDSVPTPVVQQPTNELAKQIWMHQVVPN